LDLSLDLPIAEIIIVLRDYLYIPLRAELLKIGIYRIVS